MMKIGCRRTTLRNVFAFLAVIQCWKRCGNMADRQRHEHVRQEVQVVMWPRAVADRRRAPRGPGRNWATLSEAATGPPSFPITRNSVSPAEDRAESAGVQGVGKGQASHPAAEDVGQHHEAHAPPSRASRECPPRSRGRAPETPGGHAADRRPGAEDVDHHVRNHQAHEDREEDHPQGRALEAVAEELDLRAVAERLPKCQSFMPIRKKQAEWMIPDHEAICP